jgi:hypothetical protein
MTENTYPRILGETDIPTHRTSPENKAQACRAIINQLHPGKATIVEFDSKKEAEDHRSMLYTMAILKFGEAGQIATKLIANVLYVWLVENGHESA